MPRKHVVITGTGRAGTSFLIQLLTFLGLDTGRDPQKLIVNKHARAGLESDVRRADAPYVVKSPWFCDYAADALARPELQIEHVFVPMRDLHAAAESRRYVTQAALADPTLADAPAKPRPSTIPGGLWHTDNPAQQEEILLKQLYKLMLVMSGTHIPVTLLQYPRLVKDSAYLYAKLQPILADIPYPAFAQVFTKTVRPNWVHRFNENDNFKT